MSKTHTTRKKPQMERVVSPDEEDRNNRDSPRRIPSLFCFPIEQRVPIDAFNVVTPPFREHSDGSPEYGDVSMDPLVDDPLKQNEDDSIQAVFRILRGDEDAIINGAFNEPPYTGPADDRSDEICWYEDSKSMPLIPTSIDDGKEPFRITWSDMNEGETGTAQVAQSLSMRGHASVLEHSGVHDYPLCAKHGTQEKLSRKQPPSSQTDLAVPSPKKLKFSATHCNDTAPTLNKPQTSVPFIVQPWHVVVGDRHAREDKTTVATTLLRQVKATYKQKHRGKKRCSWIPLAIADFRRQLKSRFDDIDPADLGRVLIKCTSNATKNNNDSILVPCLYGYPHDREPAYGIAKSDDESLTFFLNSNDAPSLKHELVRHKRNLTNLRQSGTLRNAAAAQVFENTLDFFSKTLNTANGGEVMSKELFKLVKPINALKEQWKLLVSLESTKKTSGV